MRKVQILEFVNWLKQKNYRVIAPHKDGNNLYVKEVFDVQDIDFSRKVPVNTFKEVLLPPREALFNYKGAKMEEAEDAFGYECGFLMTIFDLKAVGLYHQVFEKDPYYQRKRQKTLLVGQAFFEASGFCGHLRDCYEEEVLEHIIFDILLVKTGKNNWKVFTGSEKGQKILEKFGVKDYEHIEFAGLVKEEGIDPMIPIWKKKVKESYGKKIWNYWGEVCLACGKCVVNCPTCFCFDIEDEASAKKTGEGRRIRTWTTCFYNSFSEIGGGYKFLKVTSDRIYNWYCHKYVRIPREYGILGCVQCGRCDAVCPVGIKRANVLKSLDFSDDLKPRK